MLAYRHQFHAGNFADVFKHALLVQLALAMRKKDKPFFYLDTHAGVGLYDLQHPWAQKNAEHANGIALLFERKDTVKETLNKWAKPPCKSPTSGEAGFAKGLHQSFLKQLSPYLEAVRAENPAGALRYYPGSPRLVRRTLRPQDRMVLVELNRKDCETLAAAYARDKQVTVEHADGYQALNALLPPKERRALIFIDSSFDRAREFDRLTRALAAAHRKFATGTYAIWYPLMEAAAMHAFERGLVGTGIRKILQLEIYVHPPAWTVSMRGCGMVVVNPPYQFADTAQALLAGLTPILKQTTQTRAADSRVAWLVPE